MKILFVWLASCLIWSTVWLFIKLGLRDLPPISFAGLRLVIAVAVLLPVLFVKRAQLPRGARDWLLIAVTGLLLLGLSYALMFWGAQHISSGLMAVLHSTTPAFGLAFANYYLPDERITLLKLCALALGGRLRGGLINFEKVTVTGTENLMMAATLAAGKTTINNAACEPEIADLAELLNNMGARVRGAGTPTIEIEGVEALGGAEHTIIPDRIETGTFIVAAAITRGELEIKGCHPEHSAALINKLREVGVEIEEVNQSTLHVTCCPQGLKARDVTTEPHPRFPTDMQAQYMALMTQAKGRSVISETIFENRFMHASEMQRMGARIHIEGRVAAVEGPTRLTGAPVQASDLRASASLVLAGLAANGETVIDRVYHIDRGYEKIEDKLRNVGADIERLRDSITAPLNAPQPEDIAAGVA